MHSSSPAHKQVCPPDLTHAEACLQAVRADLSGEKLKEVEKKLPAEFQAVAGRAAAAEAALIKEADMLAGKVRARVENLRERLMGELIEEIGALRIKELPPVLESLWRECLSPFDPEVPWEEFRDAASTSTLGVRGSSVSLENWFRDNTEHDIEEFLEATLRPRMVQRSTAKDRATVGDLCGLSRRAELRLRLKRENVDLSSLAILLGVASASPAQTETPEGDKAFSEDVAVRLEGWQAGTREWLVERVLGWVDGSQTGGVGEAGGRRTFVLLSGPGMGKTALAAHIARQLLVRGDLLAGHFVRAGDEDRIDPRHVLRSLARQAATNGPKAARGAIQEAAKQARWEEATVGELAEAVLIDPLLPHAPSRPMVLLIDALDEGRVGSSNPVLDLLRLHLLRLPDWVRIVVTGRPEQVRVSSPLQGLLVTALLISTQHPLLLVCHPRGLQISCFHALSQDVLSVQAALSSGEPEVLEPSAEQNRNDLRQFISARLSSAMPEEDRAAAIEALLEKSEGVFAYIAKMIDLVHTDSKTRSMTLGQLPQGLSALYSDYLSRQFVHGGDLDESALKHLRGFVLPLLTVAQEPLPVDLLRHLLAEVPSCDVIIGRLGSLFPIAADGTVTAFHKSVSAVAMWLAQQFALFPRFEQGYRMVNECRCLTGC